MRSVVISPSPDVKPPLTIVRLGGLKGYEDAQQPIWRAANAARPILEDGNFRAVVPLVCRVL